MLILTQEDEVSQHTGGDPLIVAIYDFVSVEGSVTARGQQFQFVELMAALVID